MEVVDRILVLPVDLEQVLALELAGADAEVLETRSRGQRAHPDVVDRPDHMGSDGRTALAVLHSAPLISPSAATGHLPYD
jgi:hypothetical protein